MKGRHTEIWCERLWRFADGDKWGGGKKRVLQYERRGAIGRFRIQTVLCTDVDAGIISLTLLPTHPTIHPTVLRSVP